MMNEESKYRYLFPYEKVPAGSRILIYGAGVLGQEYLRQILITGYCDVVGFLDKNYECYQNMRLPVYSPNKAAELKPDYVVVALRGELGLEEIKRILLKQGFEDTQIVYVLERTNLHHCLFGGECAAIHEQSLSYASSHLSFAFLVSGGFGDMIIQKPLVMEFARLVPEVNIDIYASRDAKFLKWLYSDCLQIKNIIADSGVQYLSRKDKYSLSFRIIGSGFLEIDHFCQEDFAPGYTMVSAIINSLQKKCVDENLSVTLPSAIMFRRRIYNGENCYTGFSYGGIIPIRSYRATIPFLKVYEEEYSSLHLPFCYITVNTGNGISPNGEGVAKAWPIERFQKTVDLFKEKYSDVAVVQIGASDELRLKNIDYYAMGRDWGLVAYILKNSVFHLDIEGGLVHLASQIGTKCIVLFGPTSMEYNAYLNNTNIKIGRCHDCYGYYLDTNRCARNMEKPECMYLITPEIVMQHIDDFMKERG